MRILHKVEDYLLLILAVVLFFDVLIQIISRYLPVTLSLTEELGRYLFIYMVCFGISRAVRTNEHIRVTYFVSFLPQKLQYYIALLADFLFLIFLLVVIYVGATNAYFHFQINKMAISFALPLWIFTICRPISFAVASVTLIGILMKKIMKQHESPRV